MKKSSEPLFWADRLAGQIVRERGKKDIYTCAAGITPSGTVHIGNFREIITVDIVSRALQKLGKKTRFIYSWDDYDRLRKVPENIPDGEKFAKYLLKPITLTPDPWGCHKSWAEHFEKEVEAVMPELGINPEYIRQSLLYGKCAYAEEIKLVLSKRDKIKKILDKYRKEPLPDDWWPLRIYCEKCGYESTRVVDWDGEYNVMYSCRCGHQGSLDLRKKGVAKLPWRVDWPMRWHFEGVDFEPAGKEHSTPGGSRTVGMEIIEAVWGEKAPVYQMYDFIILEQGGKMSSSAGTVLKIRDVLDIYIPEVMRFLFAGTRPVREFAIPVGEGVFKAYEDFYKTERIYFGEENVPEKTKNQHTRIYELSCPGPPPKQIPIQPSFRHAVTLINIYREPKAAMTRVLSEARLTPDDTERYRAILERARNWLENRAPERWRFEVADDVPEDVKKALTEHQKDALGKLGKALEKDIWDENALTDEFYRTAKGAGLNTGDFFRAMYLTLIGREQGPRLAPFVLAIGTKKVAKLLKSLN